VSRISRTSFLTRLSFALPFLLFSGCFAKPEGQNGSTPGVVRRSPLGPGPDWKEEEAKATPTPIACRLPPPPDPCKDEEIPLCPYSRVCEAEDVQKIGAPCSNDEFACGNADGDHIRCVAHTWVSLPGEALGLCHNRCRMPATSATPTPSATPSATPTPTPTPTPSPSASPTPTPTPPLATDICDEGTLEDDCYVWKYHRIADGALVKGSGNLIIQAGGSLNAWAPLASLQIEMGGDIDVEKDGAIAGNLKITSTNLTIQVGGLVSADGWGAPGSVDDLGGVGGAAGGSVHLYIKDLKYVLGDISASGLAGTGGGDGGAAGTIYFHGGEFLGFALPNTDLCQNTESNCQGRLIARGGDGSWSEGHVGIGGAGGSMTFYGPMLVHGGYYYSLRRGQDGQAPATP